MGCSRVKCPKCGSEMNECYFGGYACPYCDCGDCPVAELCADEELAGELDDC